MGEYSYPFVNEEGKVICQICGKPFLVISPKHIGTHNIKYAEYKLRFPDAPLSSKEFATTSKYGREKVLFVEEEMNKFEEEVDLPEDDFEEIVVDEAPEIDDEINLRAVLEEQNKETDVMAKSKNKVLDHLRMFFTNIEKDYLIDQYGPDGRLKFHYITDFCDPVLKIVIQFPKSFWHNKELFVDLTKNIKLKSYGWKVIEINSKSPTFDEITTIIESS